MVQQPNNVKVSVLNLLAEHDVLKESKQINNKLILGASVTVNDLLESAIMLRHFSKLPTWFKLISSEQIRNMATLAGNFVNASPIGDMSIFFLALNSKLTVADKKGLKRTIALKEFFLDYKKLDLKENEIIQSIEFELPDNKSHFNFEKVSKRLHLDIASVNSAIKIKMDGDIIKDACLSAGGIGPIPAFLSKTSSFLTGKPLTIETLFQAEKVIQGEIRPISDVRGSESYKRLLLRQLFFTHFIEMFPDAFAPDTLLSALQTV
jgi:xanthine dehydrogenase small subunit